MRLKASLDLSREVTHELWSSFYKLFLFSISNYWSKFAIVACATQNKQGGLGLGPANENRRRRRFRPEEEVEHKMGFENSFEFF